MAVVILYILVCCALISLLAALLFAAKLPRPGLPIHESITAQPYRRLYAAIFLSITFSVLLALTSDQFNPTGVFIDARGGLPFQVHLTFLGYLSALAAVAAGIIVVNALWSPLLHAVRQLFSSKWAETRILGIALGVFVRSGFVLLGVIVVASGVFLLFSSDRGGLLRNQALDETEIYARFAAQPTRLYESSDLSSRILGTLVQNTCVSILHDKGLISINGMVSVVVNDGDLNHQKGWVTQADLSKDPNVGALVYLGNFVTGLVHPLTLKSIVLMVLVSGAVIGLFSLVVARLYRRFGVLISILLGVLFLVLRYSPFETASVPGAMFLIPEAFVVLLFDFALTKLILLTPPPPKVQPAP